MSGPRAPPFYEMGRPLRLGLAGKLVELSIRTLHGRFLLKPSSLVNIAIRGTIGRAQRMTGMRICAVVVLSNHYHMLVLPDSELQLKNFMQFVNSNIARQLGRLYGWREKFWSRRFKPIPISDEPEAQIARFRHLLEQGVKELLVEKPGDWPGVQCVHELTSGARYFYGTWHERTMESKVRRSGRAMEKIGRRNFLTTEATELTVAPFLEDLSPEERNRFFRKMVRSIERDWKERRSAEGRTVLGKKRIERQDPLDSPEHSKHSRAPIAHAATAEVYRQMCDRYRALVRQYRLAADRLRAGLKAQFPEGSFPPPSPFVSYSRAGPT